VTEIDFYSGGGDRLDIACRLIIKAMRKGFKIMVYTPDLAMIEQLDNLLWTFSPTDFIPHCRADDKLADVTPVILGHKTNNLPHDEVLLNLDIENPAFFSRFRRLIEIAGIRPEDTEAARKRYRFYQDRGYEIRHHKLGTS
jgi:DNA polymerase-3 subunit chi